MNLLSLGCYCFFSFQIQKKFFLLFFFFFLLFVITKSLFICIQNQFPLISIYNSHLPFQVFRKFHSDQGRNVHGSCQDSSMGISRSLMSNKAQHFALIQLYCFTGCQIFCHQDHRLFRVHCTLFLSLQNPDHTV